MGRLFPVTQPSVAIFSDAAPHRECATGLCLSALTSQRPPETDAVRRTRQKVGLGMIYFFSRRENKNKRRRVEEFSKIISIRWHCCRTVAVPRARWCMDVQPVGEPSIRQLSDARSARNRSGRRPTYSTRLQSAAKFCHPRLRPRTILVIPAATTVQQRV